MNLNQYQFLPLSRPAVEAIEELEIPVPAPEEQVKIARFLNLEGARIDALISKKPFHRTPQGETSGTYRTRRHKGLDAKVKMKDSGWSG